MNTELARVPKTAMALARQFQDAQLARPTQPIAIGTLIEIGWATWMKQQRASQKEAADG